VPDTLLGVGERVVNKPQVLPSWSLCSYGGKKREKQIYSKYSVCLVKSVLKQSKTTYLSLLNMESDLRNYSLNFSKENAQLLLFLTHKRHLTTYNEYLREYDLYPQTERVK
jgi:hypothetical protein